MRCTPDQYAAGWMDEWFHTHRVPLKRSRRTWPGPEWDNAAMDILLNGATTHVPSGCSVAGLLVQAGLGERRVAVEVNGTIVPRSAHATHPLRDGDRVEIVHALGGG
jgi:sulfur carrier protein